MLRIAYILTPVEFGGSEKVNLTFLRNVDRVRYDVCPIVLVRPWENENIFIEGLKRENYPIHKIPVALKPRGEGRDYLRVLRCIRDLYRILSKGSFHLVHSHGYFGDIIGMPVSKLVGIPQISTCHGFISNNSHLKIYNRLDLFSLRFCYKVIAVSEGIKDDLIDNGVDKTKITMIQNAVEENYSKELFIQNRKIKQQLLNIGDKEFVLGYVGRLSKEKGINYLIEASSMLFELGLQVRVLIIGEGPEKKKLGELAKEKGIGNRFFFAGFQKNVEDWIPAIDVFVLPSLTEGTPMSLLEAMAWGIPVVASAVGGVPQVIISGKNGILVTPGKPEEIADAVKTLYQNGPLRKSLGEEGKKTIELKFNVSEWVKQIEAEYLRTIHKAGK